MSQWMHEQLKAANSSSGKAALLDSAVQEEACKCLMLLALLDLLIDSIFCILMITHSYKRVFNSICVHLCLLNN